MNINWKKALVLSLIVVIPTNVVEGLLGIDLPIFVWFCWGLLVGVVFSLCGHNMFEDGD